KPTISELCELLYWGIRSSAPDILKDINVENLVELRPKISRRKKVRPKPGDVVAIPANKDSVFLVLYLGLFGRFGHAFGILRGRPRRKPPAAGWQPQAIARPIFTGLEAIALGRWSGPARTLGNLGRLAPCLVGSYIVLREVSDSYLRRLGDGEDAPCRLGRGDPLL